MRIRSAAKPKLKINFARSKSDLELRSLNNVTCFVSRGIIEALPLKQILLHLTQGLSCTCPQAAKGTLPHPLPQGVSATVLFNDVVSSTIRYEALEDVLVHSKALLMCSFEQLTKATKNVRGHWSLVHPSVMQKCKSPDRDITRI